MWCQLGDRELRDGARRGTKYCSAACRARAYRERQRGARLSRGDDGRASGDVRRAVRSQGRTRSKAAQRRTGENVHAPEGLAHACVRVAFDEQVLAQAPDDAVGYRVVLPGRDEWDTPRVVPDPNVMGSPSFWQLRPFELPDDIRLRAGKRYRLLWVDARGTLVRPVGNRHLPALRFFLGPPDDARVEKSVTRTSGRAGLKKRQSSLTRTDQAVHPAAIEVPGGLPRVEPTQQMQVAASAEPGQAIQNVAVLPHAETSVPREQSAMWDAEAQANLTGVQPQASTSSDRTDDSAATTTLESVHEAPIVSPVQAADTSVAALASLSADAGTPSSAKNDAQSPSTSSADQHSNNSPANSLKLAVQVEQRTPDVAEATWATAHAPMEAAQAGASCVPACSPPLTEGEIRDLSGIVLHTEKCAAFMHEVECRHAHVFKRPAPTAPEFNLRPDERQRLQAIARDPRLSRAAIDLRRAWLGCRLLGPDSMYRLPPPFVSLTEVEAGRIKAILNNLERRTYARYAAARVEALELGLSLPPQPTSDLPPKVRRQIRQLFSDSRLLTLIQHGLWTREPELENQPEVAEPGDPGAAQAASE